MKMSSGLGSPISKLSRSISELVEPKFSNEEKVDIWARLKDARRSVLPHTRDKEGHAEELKCSIKTGRYLSRSVLEEFQPK